MSVGPAQALLLVDLQRGVLDGAEAVPGAGALVERVSGLLDRAREAGALVIHLQNDGPPGTVDEPGRPGWALHLPLGPEPGEVVLRKSTDDGFAGTPLADLLADRGVRRVVICGLLSEMCVSATARGALARGLEVVLPHDGHGTYDLGDIPAAVVARVAEHALGDEPEVLSRSTEVTFAAAPRARPRR